MLPGWFFVVVALVSLGGAGTLGWLAWDAYGPSGSAVTAVPTTSPSSPTPSESPTPSPTPTPTPSPTPSESPSPTPSPTPEVGRDDIAVSVLNATRTQGLAAQVGASVTQAGWTLNGVGNWRGGAAQTAVHYPAGREAEARLLADDLGIGPVVPSVAGMSGDRLTVLVLSVP